MPFLMKMLFKNLFNVTLGNSCFVLVSSLLIYSEVKLNFLCLFLYLKEKGKKEKKFAFEPGNYWSLVDLATLACLRVGNKDLRMLPFTEGLLTANTCGPGSFSG